MTRKRMIAFVGLVLCFTFLFNATGGPMVVRANSDALVGYQDRIDKISQEINNLKGEKEEILKNIESVKGEKEQKIAVLNHIDQQISLTQQDIALIEERISLLLLSIEEKELEIEGKQQEYDKNSAIFLQRARAMYMYDTTSTLGLVLGADSFADFLTTTDMLLRVADHDQTLMDNLEKERLALELEKEELEKAQKAVEADREEAERLNETLSSQRTTASAAVQDIATMEKQYLADLDQNRRKSEAMQAEMDNIYKQIELSKNPYVGGEMLWPVPGYYQITSEYGWRFGGKDFHTGMDISGSGVHGKNVVAANDGVVRHVNWSHTPGRGYGIYVIVDHGGNVSTLYAHLSNISVSLNQSVSKGDVLGQVGSTGWSTGPHLHFEVREGTQHKNPLPYVKG